jgi:beta-galactosidase/beta-glucuronidase
VLLEAASAINGAGQCLQADHPIFLEACADHLRALVRRDRSHPSVAAWRLDRAMNTTPGFAGYRRALAGLKEQVRALDPTRIALSS